MHIIIKENSSKIIPEKHTGTQSSKYQVDMRVYSGAVDSNFFTPWCPCLQTDPSNVVLNVFALSV